MRRYTAVWSAWSLVPLSVALFLGGIASALTTRSTAVEITYGSVAEPDSAVLGLTTVLTFSVVGAIIASRHPRNAIGWIFCSVGLVEGLQTLAAGYAEFWLASGSGIKSLAEMGAWFSTWSWIILLSLPTCLLLLLFPDGRLPSPRWRPAAWCAGLGTTGFAASLALEAGPLEDFPQIVNPYGVDSPIVVVVPVVAGLVVTGSMAVSAFSLIARLRRAGSEQRQQIKWLAYGGAVVVGTIFASALISIWSVPVSIAVIKIALLGLPIFTGIAIFKHRLYDIDLIINRTLVYGALTLSVAGVYVFAVGYLGALFRTGDNFFVSLVAAGLVAVLFAPLRERLQRAVNRLMYGERDDPYAVVSRLGQRLEATLAPDAVLPTIVENVREALKLPYVAITLQGDDRPVASAGKPVDKPLRLPLTYRGEPIGELLLGPRSPNETFGPADRHLLEGLARQAGVAAYAVRLTTDLQRSRERLVAAREEERRRLRRDLHDSLGAQLAGLHVQVGTLRRLIPRDPAAADELVVELREELRAAIADIRRLVYDLRPPALDDLGLVATLHQLAERYGSEGGQLRVVVKAPEDLPHLPAAIEVAVYRIAQEALTNVVRHARAKECVVRLAVADDASLEVTDDGIGLPDEHAAGVGLSSMRERAAELGGTCVVEKASEDGTRVLVRLPLPKE